MTGYLSSSGNKLSLLTAQSFRDMGYVVDMSSDAIDAFDTRYDGRRLGGDGVRLTGCLDEWASLHGGHTLEFNATTMRKR